jgi:hypothetical protein
MTDPLPTVVGVLTITATAEVTKAEDIITEETP